MLDKQRYTYTAFGSPGLSQPSNQSNKFSYYTQVSPLGLNEWVQTTSYPISLIDGGCSTSNNYIYCVGGGNYSDPKAAYHAPLSAAGIGEWKNTTPYPIGLFDAGCTIYYTLHLLHWHRSMSILALTL